MPTNYKHHKPPRVKLEKQLHSRMESYSLKGIYPRK